MSKQKKTSNPAGHEQDSAQVNATQTKGKIRRPPSQGYYIAHMMEEISGRPIPGVPVKIMGEDPFAVGKNVAELIKQRYPGVDPKSLQSMARVKLLSLLLPASYLVIRLEYPPEHVNSPKRTKAFSYFLAGLRESLSQKNQHHPIIRRRPKPDLASY